MDTVNRVGESGLGRFRYMSFPSTKKLAKSLLLILLIVFAYYCPHCRNPVFYTEVEKRPLAGSPFIASDKVLGKTFSQPKAGDLFNCEWCGKNLRTPSVEDLVETDFDDLS